MSFDFFDCPELLEIQREGFYSFLNQGISELLAKQFPIKIKNGSYSIELLLNQQNIKLITPELSPRDCILKMKTYSCKLYAQVKIVCHSQKHASNTKQSFFQNKRDQSDTTASLARTKRSFGFSQKISRIREVSKQEILFDDAPRSYFLGESSSISKHFPKKNVSDTIIYQSLPEWVLLGQLPMMTKRGHFIINGSPRVIVHQVVRSPGIYFQKLIKKEDQNFTRFYGDIIPLKGVWVRLQMTKKGRIEAKFKKGKKVQVEFLQKCLQVIEDQSTLLESSFDSKQRLLNAYEETPRLFPFKRNNKLNCRSYPYTLANESPLTYKASLCTHSEGIYITSNDAPVKTRVLKKSQARNRIGEINYAQTLQQETFEKERYSEKNHKIGLSSNYNFSLEDYSVFLDKRKSRAISKAEDDAFVHTYDKLYRTTQDKELEEWQGKKNNLSYFKGLNPENAFKRKKCSENLFALFKIPSRYDLGFVGREKINDKFGFRFTVVSSAKIANLLISLVPLTSRMRGTECAVSPWRYSRTAFAASEASERQTSKPSTRGASCITYGDATTVMLPKRSFVRIPGTSLMRTKFRFVRDASPYKALLCTGYKQLQRSSMHHRASCINASDTRVRKTVLKKHPVKYSLRKYKKQSSSYLRYKSLDLLESKKNKENPTKLFRESYDNSDNCQQLTSMDLSSASDWLYKLRKGEKLPDDIDHSQNRRVRTSGELLQTQFENGVDRLRNLLSTKLQEWTPLFSPSSFSSIFKSNFCVRYNDVCLLKSCHKSSFSYSRIEKTKHFSLKQNKTKTAFSSEQFFSPSYKISVKEIFSTKPITGALREFFGSNPLSQYMDQTNPLAEITHKRRISSLGIGGVSRESAGMAIRGIHPTHYGRICPIETPEGKNAGLVNSLAFYTKVDANGFLKTPYYRVIKGQIQTSFGFSFTSAKEESLTGLYIAPSDLQKSDNNVLRTKDTRLESVPVRVTDNQLDVFKKENPDKVQAIGISPIQMISVATSLIPFLEHNDANRALMGSNMQRQAVPLMISERPIVGTGLESIVIVESGHITESQESGFASEVTASKIVIDRLSSIEKTISDPTCFLFNGGYQFCNKKLLNLSPISDFHLLSTNTSRTITKRSFENSSICKEIGTQRYARNLALQSSCLPDASRSVPRSRFSRLRKAIAGGYKAHALRSKASFTKRSFVRDPLRLFCEDLSRTKLRFVSSQRIYRVSEVKRGLLVSPHVAEVYNANQDKQAKDFFQKSKNKKIKGSKITNRKFLVSKQQSNFFLKNRGFTPFNAPARLDVKEREFFQKQERKKHFFLSSETSLTTFSRSNQNTCITEKPLIREFDWVQKGDILSDCSASNNGELAVGKNILVAYIPWEGYNFEDAIVISERLVREHVYTSLHIERYTFQAQDLKDGNEWFTKNLPGIEDNLVEHLEESGLPKIGSFLKEGDIIVGKIRYLNKKPSSPYERLLCDILGEKNFAARNKSLYVPKGVEARVIYHRIINQFDNQSESQVRPPKAARTVNIFLGEKRVIQVGDKISGRHGNKGVISTILPRQDMPYLPDGTPIDLILNPLGVPSRMNVGQVLECLLGLAANYLNQHFKISAFDERYGVEASKSLVFLKLYQARLQSGQNWLFQVSFPGKTRLVDGRSGLCFDQWITVGKAYILKLIHMVSEKIHARSTGPYALITQQPLRGRSNKGGQRLGEMEVWALEGFGAAYTLQELLTKKSDDFFGRKQIVDSILPNPLSVVDTLKPNLRVYQNRLILGHPEIFKVLLCELQALCLDLGVYIVTPESFKRSFLGIVH